MPVCPVKGFVFFEVSDPGAVVAAHRNSVSFGAKLGAIYALDKHGKVAGIIVRLDVSLKPLKLSRLRRRGLIIITSLRFLGDYLSATFRADAKVSDHTFRRCTISLWFVADLKVLQALRVVPVGKDESHATLDRAVQFIEVVAAIFLKGDLILPLGQRGANLPELLVRLIADELVLHGEPQVRVDHGTARTVGVGSVIFNALYVHACNALRDSIASAVAARIGLGRETKSVGLHDIDGPALRGAILVNLAARTIIGGNEVCASDATGLLLGDVDVVLNAAAS